MSSKKMLSRISVVVFLILLVSMVSAETYTKTGRKDFNVYSDPKAELSDYIYQTVSINISDYPGEDFKCVNMIFYDNGTLVHVQSNPPHSPQDTLRVFSNPANSPETLGYFPVYNGISNVYYRSKDLIPYNNFTYVIKCNSNQTELVYEEQISPVYKEFAKDAPARGVWFAKDGNASMIVLFGAVLVLVLAAIYYKMTK